MMIMKEEERDGNCDTARPVHIFQMYYLDSLMISESTSPAGHLSEVASNEDLSNIISGGSNARGTRSALALCFQILVADAQGEPRLAEHDLRLSESGKHTDCAAPSELPASKHEVEVLQVRDALCTRKCHSSNSPCKALQAIVEALHHSQHDSWDVDQWGSSLSFL